MTSPPSHAGTVGNEKVDKEANSPLHRRLATVISASQLENGKSKGAGTTNENVTLVQTEDWLTKMNFFQRAIARSLPREPRKTHPPVSGFPRQRVFYQIYVFIENSIDSGTYSCSEQKIRTANGHQLNVSPSLN